MLVLFNYSNVRNSIETSKLITCFNYVFDICKCDSTLRLKLYEILYSSFHGLGIE